MFNVSGEGLVTFFRALPIYGRVSYLGPIKPSHAQLDVLLVATEQNNLFILEWEPLQHEFVTRYTANLHERVGKLREQGHIGAVDPQSRAVCMDIYEGFLKFAPLMPRGGLGELLNMRIDELYVNDVQFLYGCERPTVAVLYSDIHSHVHVTSYAFHADEKKLKKGPLALTNIDAGTGFVVPVPFGGAVLLGEQIVYYTPCVRDKPSLVVSKNLRNPTVFKAWTMITPTVYLLGDFAGKLHLLTLVTKSVPPPQQQQQQKGAGRAPCSVIDMHIEVIGTTSIPSSLSHIGASTVFVGSQMGDSHVIRITGENNNSNNNSKIKKNKNSNVNGDISSDDEFDDEVFGIDDVGGEKGNGFETIDTFTNIGPISDFVIVDLDHRGQGQVVACSGGFKDGSIVVVRNGVGINEISSAPAPGVSGLWSLPDPQNPAKDRYLVLSYLGGTQVLELSEAGFDAALRPATSTGIVRTERTLQCSSMRPFSDGVVQVTPSAVVSLNEAGREVSRWMPPRGQRIELASLGKGAADVLLSLGKGTLVYFKIDPISGHIRKESLRSYTIRKAAAGAQEEGDEEVEEVEEVACLDVGNAATRRDTPPFCVVGTWGLEIVTLSIPDFRVLCRQKIPGDAVPRSIVVAELEDPVEAAKKSAFGDDSAMLIDDESGDDDEARANVLCGLGDGHLLTYKVNRNTGVFSDCKKLSIGTNAVDLRPVRNPETQGTTHVFASSNRPVIIFAGSTNPEYSASSAQQQQQQQQQQQPQSQSEHQQRQQRPPKKLLISSINLKEASHACTLRGAAGDRHGVKAAETFALISSGRLVIGTIDDIQKLHIRKTPQNEMPKRIAFQDETRTFGVISIRSDILPTGEEVSTTHIRMFDDQLSDRKIKIPFFFIDEFALIL